nr:hypothetical protein [Tanacetum cinerariifolium]
MSDQVKEGVGYNVVPPPTADLYLSPKKDLSWTGLPEFLDNTVTDYGMPSPTVASTSAEGQIKDSFTSEDVASPNPSKPFVKFVKPKDSQSEKCIVLGRNFKLLDDAIILFRTPRQHNMYSIDLNNIVPHKDRTCLVAKAYAYECILWHRRL